MFATLCFDRFQLNLQFNKMRPEEFLNFLNAATHFDDEKNVLYKLSPAWTLTIWICLTASLIIGWIAKYYIYLHIFNTKIKEHVIKLLNI